MTKIRITKEFSFEMAHALWNYDGLCSNIHGHSYRLSVTLTGIPVQDDLNPKNGMVADFTDIKIWVKNTVVEDLDHSVLVNSAAEPKNVEIAGQMFNRLKIMNFQPTCENLLIYIAEKISSQLPPEVRLHSLRLRETDTSYAEWYAEDNI